MKSGRSVVRLASAVVMALCVVQSAIAQAERPAADEEDAYAQAIRGRADKIVGTLGIDDQSQRGRLSDLLVEQYRGLRDIHDARDAEIAEAKKSDGSDRAVSDAQIGAARDRARLRLMDLHTRFLARLAVELTAEQIEQVKDGMTYGVVGITYARYQELLPDLDAAQKREILSNLLEARELAMDAGSSEEKHAIFGKFKGRINNYLSAAGYDLKQAEAKLATGRKAQSQ